MTLIETIDDLIKHCEEEIRIIEYYINAGDYDLSSVLLEEERQEQQKYRDHISNLLFIKYECGLDEYQQIIDKENELNKNDF
jgi:hypothetical protein